MKNIGRIKIVTILFLFLFIFFIFNYLTSYSLKNDEEQLNAIAKVLKVNNTHINIKKVCKKNEYLILLYSTNGEYWNLAIFKKNIFFDERYRYIGCASGSSEIKTYCFLSPKESIIIIYGDNTELKASYYNVNNGSSQFSEDIINQDFVLNIYKLNDRDSATEYILYDKNGLVIDKITY